MNSRRGKGDTAQPRRSGNPNEGPPRAQGDGKSTLRLGGLARESRTEPPRRHAAGLLAAAGVAVTAIMLEGVLAPTVGAVLLAMVLGLVVGNVNPRRTLLVPGLAIASKRGLRLAVILLGAQVTIAEILSIGRTALGAIVICMVFAISIVLALSRAAKVPFRLAVLIAVGTAVCGNTAIVATSSVVEAEDREVSFAVGTITVLGTLALLLFPAIGAAFDIPDVMYGIWAGLSINDTSQVVAAGAAFSDSALQTATIVKLVRNTFMAPVLLGVAWWFAHRTRTNPTATSGNFGRSALRAFPLFVLGFIGMAVLRSSGIISDAVAASMSSVTGWLIAVAIGAIGLSTDVDDLKKVGLRPFLVGLGAASALGLVGLILSGWLTGPS